MTVSARPKILFADDNDAVRRTGNLVLEPVADVTCVEDGEAALAACAGTRFDLVFLDIHMPVLDGMAACSSLREGGYAAPGFALSVDLEVRDRAEYEAAGFDGFVPKPVQPRELLRIVLENRP